ncbi:MAG: hypothetical protein LBV60_25860 [Streptomyces sp.]|jgi:hypothetical protein|nr:hypothetical protein [Streptomyces sp.]
MDEDETLHAPLPLLPLLTLEEAHDVLGVLAAVAVGGVPDRETARYVLMNLAARVPARD